MTRLFRAADSVHTTAAVCDYLGGTARAVLRRADVPVVIPVPSARTSVRRGTPRTRRVVSANPAP